ncbi:MAG: serine/threonine-protein kinase [Pseudomonadota bacterium]
MTEPSADNPFATGAGIAVLKGLDADRVDRLIGTALGDYRITGLLAEGGMSLVYRAEREDGSFQRAVAIKVAMLASHSEQARRRFVQEQQVLASLNHVNITQLYDASITPDGLPYIVMELVDGESISDWCAARDRSEAEVLRLILEVLDALVFAHQHLIVHRDIKPSNVLVDAEGRVRVLDFGIAKLLEGDGTTQTGYSPLTPEYASPEQLLAKPVSIAADLYQVGLLLFELLTGVKLLQQADLQDAIARAAAEHPVTVDRIYRTTLSRELVAIIEQCVRADPGDRYPDANALRADIERYRAGFPVQAAGQNRAYRLRKFLRRHAVASGIAAAAGTAVLGSSLWYTVSLQEARTAAETQAATSSRLLRAMSSLVTDTFTRLVDEQAERQTGTALVAKSVLEDTVALLDDELARAPSAELFRVRGTIESVLGQYPDAVDSFAAARQALDGTETLELSVGLRLEQALLHAREGRLPLARALLAEVEPELEADSLPAQARLRYLQHLAFVHRREGAYEDAVTVLETAVAAARDTDAGADREALLAGLYENLAFTQLQRGNWPAALDNADASISWIGRRESATSYKLIAPLRFGAFSLAQLGELAPAQERFERALDIARQNFGDDHPDLAAVYNGLGLVAYRQGDTATAIGYLEQSLGTLQAFYAPGHTNLVGAMSNLSRLHTDAGNMRRAAELQAEALASLDASRPENRADLFSVQRHQGRRLLAIGDYAGARDAFVAGLEHCRELLGTAALECAATEADVAQALYGLGEPEASEQWFERSQAKYRTALGESHPDYVSRRDLRWPYDLARGDARLARDRLQRVLQQAPVAASPNAVDLLRLRLELAALNVQLGDLAQARSTLNGIAETRADDFLHPLAYYADLIEAEYWLAAGDGARAARFAQRAQAAFTERFPRFVDRAARASQVLAQAAPLS